MCDLSPRTSFFLLCASSCEITTIHNLLFDPFSALKMAPFNFSKEFILLVSF